MNYAQREAQYPYFSHYISAIEEIEKLKKEVKRLREEIKDYDACLQNLWDNEMIPEDTDIWDEVKEMIYE